MAVVGYDDLYFAAELMTPLTSVRQPMRQLGWAAADLLLTEHDARPVRARADRSRVLGLRSTLTANRAPRAGNTSPYRRRHRGPYAPKMATEPTAAGVHRLLSRHMLVDGLPLVLDLKASQGSWLIDQETGERYLDMFTFFASSPWA